MVAISSLMLTTKARWWFQTLAIEDWLTQCDRQPDDELVIVSEDGIPGLGQFDEGSLNIRFVAAPAGLKLAAKRNLGIDACRNPWVLFWDDDDWHGPGRLAATRIAANAPSSTVHKRLDPIAEPPQIVGQREILFHELIGEERTFFWRYPDKAMDSDPYIVGGTLALDKRLWMKKPFIEQVTAGDEGWWTVERLRDNHVPHIVIPRTDANTYVAMIHNRNTCARPPRVSNDGRFSVLSDSNMRMLTSDPRAQLRLCIPDETLAKYHAAAWAESGEQE